MHVGEDGRAGQAHRFRLIGRLVIQADARAADGQRAAGRDDRIGMGMGGDIDVFADAAIGHANVGFNCAVGKEAGPQDFYDGQTIDAKDLIGADGELNNALGAGTEFGALGKVEAGGDGLPMSRFVGAILGFHPARR